jgi:hypothetical protein
MEGEPPASPSISTCQMRMERLAPKETHTRSTSKKYEIHSVRRVVSTQISVSPLQAVVDYGARTASWATMTRLGVDSVSWAGARFTVLAPTESPFDAMRVAGMTPEQRDSLRTEIDVRVRERMGSGGDARPVRRQA